jgi:hypothetical protein
MRITLNGKSKQLNLKNPRKKRKRKKKKRKLISHLLKNEKYSRNKISLNLFMSQNNGTKKKSTKLR